jgi:hypothetical protein
MSDRLPRERTKRRDFLKLAGLAPVAGAALAVTGAPAKAAPTIEKTDGYRKTEHIRKYYETARS